ncbi:hypothetical protein ACWIGW_44300 [Nocardia brasiliensis]
MVSHYTPAQEPHRANQTHEHPEDPACPGQTTRAGQHSPRAEPATHHCPPTQPVDQRKAFVLNVAGYAVGRVLTEAFWKLWEWLI